MYNGVFSTYTATVKYDYCEGNELFIVTPSSLHNCLASIRSTTTTIDYVYTVLSRLKYGVTINQHNMFLLTCCGLWVLFWFEWGR